MSALRKSTERKSGVTVGGDDQKFLRGTVEEPIVECCLVINRRGLRHYLSY